MTLSKRLQILLDETRYRRLEAHASRLGVPVAALVREAIDQLLPDEHVDRARAGELLLAAPPMDVEDWPAVKRRMLDEMSPES